MKQTSQTTFQFISMSNRNRKVFFGINDFKKKTGKTSNLGPSKRPPSSKHVQTVVPKENIIWEALP
jgi:hypothetical protein